MKFPSLTKLELQAIVLALITLPSIGLYFSVTLGLAWATWALMSLLILGMLLAIRVA